MITKKHIEKIANSLGLQFDTTDYFFKGQEFERNNFFKKFPKKYILKYAGDEQSAWNNFDKLEQGFDFLISQMELTKGA